MSDEEKPAEAPAPPAAEAAKQDTLPTAAPEEPQVGRKPDRVALLREKASKPREKVGPVPSVEHEQTYGFGKKIDDFDDEMEKELQEAMGGASDKDLYGEPPRKKGEPEKGPQKGHVFRIHGQDVFIDLPGGSPTGRPRSATWSTFISRASTGPTASSCSRVRAPRFTPTGPASPRA